MFKIKSINMTEEEAKRQIEFISNLPDDVVNYSELDEIKDQEARK